MKNILTRLALAAISVAFVACGQGSIGTIDQFQVFERTTLKSTSGGTHTFEPGAQAPGVWRIKFDPEKTPPTVALKNQDSGDLFEISSDFRAEGNFLESRDGSTAWRERWDSCWVEHFETICDGYGRCWTRVARFPGNQRIRERRIGSFETFEANVFNKNNAKAAYLRFVMDRTEWDRQILSPCF